MITTETLETRVLSKAFEEASAPLPHGPQVSSVAAKEFLLAQSQAAEQPSYFVLNPARFAPVARAGGRELRERTGNPTWAKRGGGRTDRLVIDFGGEFPAYREYGDQAVSLLINRCDVELHRLCVSHLPKDTRKFLLDRFRFLLAAECRCVPLDLATVEAGLDLFAAFTLKFNCNANVANTVNDALIYATAIRHGLRLRTEDLLLARFAAEMHDAPCREFGGEATVDFSRPEAPARKVDRESKGYRNQGWSYSYRNRRAVSGT